MKKILGDIKDFCIKDTFKTLLLVLILVGLYIVLNLWMRTINLAQIDMTKDKLYTLTDQSKNIAKTIDKDITFYVWGYNENSSVIDLLKQYNTTNSKIKYKVITADDLENKEKYSFEDNYPSVIGEAEDGRRSYIDYSDLYSYDSSYNMIDLTEQKLTNALNNLSNNEKTKVYFLQGKTMYSPEDGLYYLNTFLTNEYYEVDTINIISDPTIPEDCDVLALMDLSSDLSEIEADNICNYIENGGDMIITLDPTFSNANRDYPNFQRVLDEYAISMPNKIVRESSEYVLAGATDIIFQSGIASDHEITRLLFNYDSDVSTGMSLKPILAGSGIIELDTEKMTENNMTATPILMTSSKARVTNIATDSEEELEDGNGYYVLGAAVQKMVESGEESRATIYAATSSFSDMTIDGQNPMILYNSNIIMNSFAFVSNRGELYSIRKSSALTQFNLTERQDEIIKVIIYTIPVIIIIIGAFVWIKRRKLK